MEKAANKARALLQTPLQEVDKLVSTCQVDTVRVYSPEEMLLGDL